MRLILILLGLAGLAPAQQTFLYSAGSGDTTCKFHTNTPTPTTVDFTCTNPRGTFGGYYTPTTTNTATDVMTIGMAGGVGNTGNEVCMMAVNMSLPSFCPGFGASVETVVGCLLAIITSRSCSKVSRSGCFTVAIIAFILETACHGVM